jgi:peptidoglycan/xylan/chitin deacetylase (PgdA/CDA1 family)
MKKDHRLSIAWTNDDISTGDSCHLRCQLEMLDRHGIPGVFFVIPSNHKGDIDQDEELLALIAEARKNGHEFYQHGYKHFCFECGIPTLDMFNLDPGSKAYFDSNRDDVEAHHTLEALVEMLENGQRIWRRAFGEPSVGFRPGWGSYCGNFYKALKILGYQWVSSRIPSMTSYLQQYDKPIEFYAGVNTGPHLLKQGVWEFPIGPEIAWRVPNDPKLMDVMVDMGMRHFEAMYEKQEPMLMVSHYHGLNFHGKVDGNEGHPVGTGYAVHDKFIPHVLQTGKARFVGMKELVSVWIPQT